MSFKFYLDGKLNKIFLFFIKIFQHNLVLYLEFTVNFPFASLIYREIGNTQQLRD